jgi:Membrane transporters of cations and cationic drugs
MNWLIFCLAGCFEVVWVIALKYSQGLTKLVPSAITAIALGVSLFLLSQSTKTIPVSTAYAVWTGVGATGTVIAGIVLFAESVDLWRIVCIVAITAGIIGLRLHAE